MSILAKNELTSRLNTYKNDSIIVTPLLNKDTQINQIGIDCRLSNQFIILKTQHIESFDIKKQDVQRQYQEELVVPFGYGFILHPQSMVLGSTFEFISLPDDIVASIEGRSSWARMGLMIATAVYVEPGFKGCITLELSNVSNIPIKLYPGMRIGQIIFSKTSSPSKYENKKYQFAIGPEISKIKNDSDTAFFVEIGLNLEGPKNM
jgi:dCTP deaminase